MGSGVLTDMNSVNDFASRSDQADRFLGELLVIEGSDATAQTEFFIAAINAQVPQFGDRALRQRGQGGLGSVVRGLQFVAGRDTNLPDGLDPRIRKRCWIGFRNREHLN